MSREDWLGWICSSPPAAEVGLALFMLKLAGPALLYLTRISLVGPQLLGCSSIPSVSSTVKTQMDIVLLTNNMYALQEQ